MHLQNAKNACDKNLNGCDYATSVREFGFSLHPIQDKAAHGDFPGGGRWHNLNGPPLNGASGYPDDYPDDITLDAANSTDGIPSGPAVHSSNSAVFEHALGIGKRFTKTKQDTLTLLGQFETFIRASGSFCCKKEYLVTF
jgi:hypothetical protein